MKNTGIQTTGGKLELADRIISFLSTGKISEVTIKTKSSKSKFDWHSQQLSLDTVITGNYKNT